jgi:hypothetical protein
MLSEAAFSPMLADIRLIGLAIAVLVLSVPGLFLSKNKLVGMAPAIGTKNPKVARIVCVIGVVLGVLLLIVGIALQVGLLG